MGFIGSLFGGTGSDFKAKPVEIDAPADAAQAGTLYARGVNALDRQSQFVNQLASQGGMGNLADVFTQQQLLARALQDQANGAGPNPVQAQLAQNTGQNVANQAALMAGQRGVGANAGLLARQIGQQGAGIQQQAVGQAATLGAQQQLAAQQALQQQQAQMANIANSQVNQQAQALSGLNQFAQGLHSNLIGGVSNFNNSKVSEQNSINAANSGVAAANASAQGGIIGGALGGLGSYFGLSAGKKMAYGGEVEGASKGPKSFAGKYLCAAKGGQVPGQAPFKGDSLKNDKVHAILSPGEVVIPRHVMQSKDPPKMAADFVRAVMAKKGKLS